MGYSKIREEGIPLSTAAAALLRHDQRGVGW